MLLADPVELFLVAAEVSFCLGLEAGEEGQYFSLKGAFREAVGEGETEPLFSVERGFFTHWFGKGLAFRESLVDSLLNEAAV